MTVINKIKQMYLIICLPVFLLNGCSLFYNPADALIEADKNAKEKYKYFTTDKNITKAFEAYKFLKFEGGEPGWLAGHYIQCNDNDFFRRFCDADYFANNWVKEAIDVGCTKEYAVYKLTQIKTFQIVGNLNSSIKLTDEDARCLALKCDFERNSHGCQDINFDWLNYEDECIVRRRSLLNKELIKWCAFNYNDYIPTYAQIGTFDDFIELYKAITVEGGHT